MKMFQKDVFLNFAGGFKVADPGLDLAVVAAVISSYYDRPVAEGVCCAGEIGLSGEVRPAPRTEQRITLHAWDSNASSYRGIWARAPNAPKGSRS